MRFEDDNDFYDKEFPAEEPKEEAEEVVEEHFTPDDPRYWEKEESEWEHLKPTRRKSLYIWAIASVAVVLATVGLYMYFFQKSVEDGVVYGYVERIEKRGTLFKTFEGTLLPYRELMDGRRVYERDFTFTAETPKVAADIKRMEMLHKAVRLEYVEYHTTLPWRGERKVVVKSVEPVNPKGLLPGELQPEIMPNGI